VEEADYWRRLEFRVCRELDGIDEYRRRGLWCDGFIPDEYALEGDPPCIRGTAWICPGQTQQAWRFTLVLRQRPTHRHGVDWAALLPAETATSWLKLDSENRHIDIDPAAAVAEQPGT
jgi:hypothetical protein